MPKTKVCRPTPFPLKCHGGKVPLLTWLESLMPPRKWVMTLVEACAGGASLVLGASEPYPAEVVNDLDGDNANFWDVLKSEREFPKLARLALATPFSEVEFDEAGRVLARGDDPVYRAWAYMVRVRMSISARMEDFSSITKARLRRGMQEQVSAWLTAVDGLGEVHARLRRVLVLRRDCVDLVADFDKPNTFIYLDPPYLETSRSAPAVYAREMGMTGHARLLAALGRLEHARFMLSGYDSVLYRQAEKKYHWHRRQKATKNHAGQGKVKNGRVEVVWMNYKPPA